MYFKDLVVPVVQRSLTFVDWQPGWRREGHVRNGLARMPMCAQLNLRKLNCACVCIHVSLSLVQVELQAHTCMPPRCSCGPVLNRPQPSSEPQCDTKEVVPRWNNSIRSGLNRWERKLLCHWLHLICFYHVYGDCFLFDQHCFLYIMRVIHSLTFHGH